MTRQTLLSGPRRRTLAAAVERILPSDDGVGAAETGVAEYLEGALGSEDLRPIRPLIEEGLDLLERLAGEHHGVTFSACTAEQRDRLLRHLVELSEPRPRIFLRRLVQLSLEGFLCDPQRGGNRDGLGWRYVGYPPEGLEPPADARKCRGGAEGRPRPR